MDAILNLVDSYDAQDKCQLEVLHFGTGAITENDVNVAEAFSGKSWGSIAFGTGREVTLRFVKRMLLLLMFPVCFYHPLFPSLFWVNFDPASSRGRCSIPASPNPFAALPGSIYGFNVEASRSVQQLAAKHGVPLHLHAVIYKLIDTLKEELSAKLPPLTSETLLGKSSTFLFAPEHLVPPGELW